ncbi:MAG: thiamine phosphate synthase [Limisphaerales bacterium]
MKPLDQCRLYTFIDTAFLRGRDPADVARQLCLGGADLVQVRAKDSTAGQVRDLAARVFPILRDAGVGMVVNDHYEIAREVGADLCHLGQEDFFAANGAGERAVKIKFPGPAFGLSTHSPEQARQAMTVGPAYIAVGPVYATSTKPGALPVTVEYVRWASSHVKIPWFVIGGINLTTLDAVLAAGAQRICVVSAILNAADMAEACRQFRKRLLPV